MNYITEQSINQFIDSALEEDVRDGDHSSLSSIPAKAEGEAQLIIKDQGIIAGVELAKKIFYRIDPAFKIEVFKEDGESITFGDIALKVKGNIQSILKSERLVLNCMQRMSGIATFTNQLNQIISKTNTRLLDTRKTTPNFRIMEKWAVKIGGGVNHRFGLFDMIILKDNHVDYAGGIAQAITSAQNYIKSTGKNLKIEIETRSLNEVKEALNTGGFDRIMLDNMSIPMMTDAVKLVNKKYETEASGGVNQDTILGIAQTGVDYISVGALTHSVKSLDMSLKAIKKV